MELFKKESQKLDKQDFKYKFGVIDAFEERRVCNTMITIGFVCAAFLMVSIFASLLIIVSIF